MPRILESRIQVEAWASSEGQGDILSGPLDPIQSGALPPFITKAGAPLYSPWFQQIQLRAKLTMVLVWAAAPRGQGVEGLQFHRGGS